MEPSEPTRGEFRAADEEGSLWKSASAPCWIPLVALSLGLLGLEAAGAQAVPKDGANFRLNELTDGPQSEVDAALIDAQGNFVAVWTGTQRSVDLVFAERNGGLGSCRGTGDGAFSNCTEIDPSHEAFGVALGDVDGDGLLDAVFATGDENDRVCLNQGNEMFTCGDIDPDRTTDATDIALGLMDDDANLDAVIAIPGVVLVCLGDGTGAFDCEERSGSSDSHGLALGDFNEDGDLDVVLANSPTILMGSGRNAFCAGDGTGDLSCTDLGTSDDGSEGVAVGDLDGDGHLDAVFANQETDAHLDPFNEVCLGEGDGTFTCADVAALPRDSFAVALGDIDEDGNLDAAFANDNTDNALCLGNGDGTFTSCSPINLNSSAYRDAAIDDLDNDGNLDLVFANLENDFGSADLGICLGDGSGGFSCSVNSDPEHAQAVALGPLSEGRGIVRRLFDAAGNPLEPDQVVQSSGPGNLSDPAVASDLAGGYLIAWETVEPGSATEVRFRSFTDAGPQSDERTVDAEDPFAGSDLEDPAVALDTNGEGVIVWQEMTLGGPKVRGQLISNGGFTTGASFTVSRIVEHDPASPAVAKHFVTGHFLVVWVSPDVDDDSPGILGRLYDDDANPLGDPFRIDEAVEMATGGDRANPAVATNFAGDHLVVWESERDGVRKILGRRLDAQGELEGSEFQVDSESFGSDTPRQPDIAVGDLGGSFLVAWESRSGGTASQIRARWLAGNFDEPAVTSVPDFKVNQATVFSQPQPAVVGDLLGDFIVAWDGPGGGITTLGDDQGILAQRYLAPVTIQINDFSVTEGTTESSAVFTLQASKPHPNGANIVVGFRTLDNTALFIEDYVFQIGSRAFSSAGPLAQPIPIEITEDTVFEEDETFFVDLISVTNAIITRPRGVGTIENDDPAGGVTVADASIMEGNSGTQDLVFEVTLSPKQQADALVSFTTVDDSALAGSDYDPLAGVLTIPAGFESGFLSVKIHGDTAFENDETFFVDLFDPSNAILVKSRGVGTILSDELCPQSPTIDFDPSMPPFPPEGGADVINVDDPRDCGWTAVSHDPWIVFFDSPNCPAGADGGCVHGGTGSGLVQYQVESNPDLDPRSGSMTVADFGVNISQDGTLCSFTLDPLELFFLSPGGEGAIAVTATDPQCTWTAASQEPWITLLASPDCPAGSLPTCVHGGTGSGVVEIAVGPNEDLDRTGSLLVAAQTVTVEQMGIFLDDFDDGSTDPEWIYSGSEPWSEGDSLLRTDTIGPSMSAQAIARPAFIGCVQCTVEARMIFEGFATGTATLYGWYLNEDNHVSLTASEFANTWTFTQRVDGNDALVQVYDQGSIIVQQLYKVVMVFDGTDFTVTLDGLPILSMAAAPGSVPDGTVGFESVNSEAGFDRIRVETVTTGNLPAAVVIQEPEAGALVVASSPVAFTGTAVDPEDGNLSGALQWTSDLDGPLGTGGSFAASLSTVGGHRITATVFDSGALPAFVHRMVTVLANEAPVVTITAPVDGATAVAGVAIDFSGLADDDGDGDLSGTLTWSSDLDGPLGTGGNISAALSPGTHTITAEATDSGSLTGADTITLEVLPAEIFGDGFESSSLSAWTSF